MPENNSQINIGSLSDGEVIDNLGPENSHGEQTINSGNYQNSLQQDPDTISHSKEARELNEEIELISEDEAYDDEYYEEIDDEDLELNDEDDIEVIEDMSGEVDLQKNINQTTEQVKYGTVNVPSSTIPLATDAEYWLSQFTELDPDYPIKAQSHYTWEIENFDSLHEGKCTSPTFKCGDTEFQILMFPKGNDNNYLALYLAPLPKKITRQNSSPDAQETIDPTWYRCVQFGFVIWNPEHPEVNAFNKSQHRFNGEEPDWGFSTFTDLGNVFPQVRPNQQCPAGIGFMDSKHKVNITCYVKLIDDVTGVLWHNLVNYDSKKETGFSGLRNQGATCYLNSLLQSYYFTRVFRKSVLQIPVDPENNQPNTFPVAIQRLFYNLEFSEDAADTSELTQSFGWDAADSFTQHDVQELNRILMDRLEGKMKGTVVEDSLNKTFVGKMKSYIKCVNVDYESSRMEDFWDIQLNVKGLKDLTSSFKSYISKEMLDGENKYDAGSFGLQDAEKGVVFEEFPNVLHLQLKRFDYDFMYDNLVKINDRHEYPEFIDLKPYLDQANSQALAENWEYELFAVLIHSGDISSGHYYAMIKPSTNSGWFRFDDDKVTRVTRNEVFEQNFGSKPLPNNILRKMTRAENLDYQIRRHTSAYMLVYFRKSKLDEILCDFDPNEDIPPHIKETIENERKEAIRRKKELEEQHLYMRIHLYGAKDDWLNYQGFDLGINRASSSKWNTDIFNIPGELVNLDDSLKKFEVKDKDMALGYPPKYLKRPKNTTIRELYEDVVQNFANLKDPGSEFRYIRLWIMAHRRNDTTRPDSPLGYGPAYYKEGLMLTVDAEGKLVTNESKITDSIDLKTLAISNLPENITIESLLDKFAAKKPHGLYLWMEDTRNDLCSLYSFSKNLSVDTLDSLNKIPRNFLGFQKLFEAYRDLISSDEKSSCTLFKARDMSNSSAHVSIFIKYFDIVNQTLTGVSHMIVAKDATISSIVPALNAFMGFAESTPLAIYEEIKPTSIGIVKQSNTFSGCELQNGDILAFSLESVPQYETMIGKYKFEKFKDYKGIGEMTDEDDINIHGSGDLQFSASKADVLANRDKLVDNVLVKSAGVQEFYKYIRSRIHLLARPVGKVEGDDTYVAVRDESIIKEEFDFWVTTQTSYQDIADGIGGKLGIDPHIIRMFLILPQGGSVPLKTSHEVSHIVGNKHMANLTLVFEYEILNIKMEELESLRLLKIGWFSSGVLHEQAFEFLVAKDASINTVVDKFVAKLGKTGDEEFKQRLTIWAVSQCRIVKTFTLEDSIAILPDKFALHIRLLDNDELAAFGNHLYNNPRALETPNHNCSEDFVIVGDGSKDFVVETVQFYKDPSKAHGIPFLFVLKAGERFGETRKRLQAKLGLGDKEFTKVHVGLLDLSSGKCRYFIKDEFVPSDELSESDVLFLDHPDRAQHRQNYGGGAIRIN
ncbi:ubiquitin-specific protease [Saccharomycopsis crataegensis]|uniref:ubiquitinyl hydrolase 1 n=1 Tax=Saccharomycopsis crataegensis TaxID=43959 RepID=A0AAV5QPW6_9ASCO|nr:ubiquitin-specific protease [Saccharomycopsis crataegensis]